MKVKKTTVGSDALKKISEEAEKAKLEVGFFESAKYPDGTSVAGVAAQNEFGNPAMKIPSRPFFRKAILENEGWKSTARGAMSAAAKGDLSVRNALNQVGLKASADVKQSITDGDYKPISDKTIASRMAKKLKGVQAAMEQQGASDKLKKLEKKKISEGVAVKPLIDTAQMLQSVNYSVSGVK